MSKKANGFTIVELLIVIVVIGILAAITVAVYSGVQNRAATSALQSDLHNAATQLGVDRGNNGSYPVSTSAANDGKGLAQGSTTEYQYTTDGETYCITATSTKPGIPAYHVSSATGNIEEGTCPGHNGPHVALNCPENFIEVPGNATYGTSGFCVMKYEAKNVGGVATSQAAGAPWASISRNNATTRASEACDGCHLITEAEWMTIAANVYNVASNWSSGVVGTGYIYSGHNDSNPNSAIAAGTNDSDGYTGTGNSSPSNQRRTLTLSNGAVIWDFAGNLWEWTDGSIASNKPGKTGQTVWEPTAYDDGSLQWGGLPSTSRPPVLLNHSQGVGQLYSNPTDSTNRAYRRGGHWGNGSVTGIYGLHLGAIPTGTDPSIGFRAAK